MSETKWSFVIAAGGHGTRLGGEAKQFRLLGGIPMWQWSFAIAEELLDCGQICEIVIVLSEEMQPEISRLLFGKDNIKMATAGAERSQSVLNGIRACSGTHLLIHDAARPFVSKKLCLELMQKAEAAGAAIPVVGISDSVKIIDGENITAADRTKFFKTQTPQAFERRKLLALLESGVCATDEATLWLEAGNKIATVEGEECNFKITTAYDWLLARSFLAEAKEIRTGHGFDIHPLVAGRKLILCGIEVKGALLGLNGHSDADVITHTVMDALLGAAGLPDIGTLFPASDGSYKDADSIKLLDKVVELLSENGWKIDWVDATLNAQIPKLGGIIDKLKNNLTVHLARDGRTVFNLKVKSGEKCGSVGRCECMKCHAVATISRINYTKHTI